eukprot:GEMP01087865.1.p1 GENE.GEMP01087865.1~~GEMP01087865.1.p1  ORF type:complete len:141 (-),score=44.82 GEMP01087865.1:403-825(-)
MSDEHAVKSLYFNILNNKSTKAAYRDSDEEKEKRHRCQLDKDRDKALKAQRKKLKERDIRDGKIARGEESSDSEIPFFMQDASIRAAKAEKLKADKKRKKAEKRALKKVKKKDKKKHKKKDKKRKKKESSSSDSDSSSSD